MMIALLFFQLAFGAADSYEQALAAGDWPSAANYALKEPGGIGWAKYSVAMDKAGYPTLALLAMTRSNTAKGGLPTAFWTRYLELASSSGLPVSLSPYPNNLPPSLLDQRRILLAKTALQEGAAQNVKKELQLIGPESASFVTAQILIGIAYNQLGHPQNALAPLLTALGKNAGTNQALDDWANLSLARTYYAGQSYDKAIVTYASVARSSPWWPRAQVERAWAHFMLGDFSGTLALLLTHESDFFPEAAFPEADLLRVQSLFLHCKYTDAVKAIERFQTTYKPEVAQRTSEATPFTRWQEDPDSLSEGVAYSLKQNLALKQAATMSDAITSELIRLKRLPGSSGTELGVQQLQVAQDALEARWNPLLQGLYARRSRSLKTWTDNLDLLKLDVMSQQTHILERAAVSGELDFGSDVQGLKKRRARPQTRRWPYEGEYWLDELGYYTLSAASDCPKER